MEKLTPRQKRQKREMIATLVAWEAVIDGEPADAATLQTWEFDKIKACAGGIVLHELERAERRQARRRMN